ncbi:hypothetical protein MKS88_001478 [Plasmodium brasilianum]|uniref:Uncharacterized protein n=1 Tax=Plasmodium brasilianum TaxID=5824 RepID=A0ACB9YFN6_PLABR|nr:hypothetical protein MKS88_001478 [Plasmodium brasilianum]
MVRSSCVFLFLLFETLLFIFANNNNNNVFFLKFVKCDVYLIHKTGRDSNSNGHIHLDINYQDGKGHLNEIEKKKEEKNEKEMKWKKEQANNITRNDRIKGILTSFSLQNIKKIFLHFAHKNSTKGMNYQTYSFNTIEKKEEEKEKGKKKGNHAFNIYRLKSKIMYKPSQNFSFLEIPNESLIKFERSLSREGTNLDLPRKNSLKSRKHSNALTKNEHMNACHYSFLEDKNEWIYFPILPITCRQTGCPNSYQMCIPVKVNPDNFDGKKIYEIVIKEFDKHMPLFKFANASIYSADNYNLVYTCVCKKYLDDGFCDESVE